MMDELKCMRFISKLLLILCLYDMNTKFKIYQIRIIPSVKKPKVYSYGTNELVTIFTKWGESLNKNNILQEYPRPQFVRDSCLNLNGEWSYSLNYGKEIPNYNDTIIVPFSIESPLSGVFNKTLKPGMTLWYKKIIDLTKIKN